MTDIESRSPDGDDGKPGERELPLDLFESDRARHVLESIIEASPDPIVVLDEALCVTLWNPAAEELLGWDKSEILGERAPFVPDEREAEFQTFIDRLERGRPNRSVETVRQSKDGQGVEVSLSSAPVEVDGVFSGYVGIYTDIRRRKERERELERQRETLMRVKEIIEGLRPINRAIAQASSPEEIVRGVCEQLATADAYLLAWYGDYNPALEQLTPNEWFGIETDDLADLDVSETGDEGSRGIYGRAIQTLDVQSISGKQRDRALEPWDEASFDGEYRSFAVVPVFYEETVYGVIGLYSGRQDAFNTYEREFLGEIGELVGHAIQAAENKRLLHSETVVELEVRTRGPESVFVELTEELDCRLELEAFIPATETSFVAYTSVEGARPEAVVDHLAESPTVEGSRVIHSDGTSGTIEYRVHESPVSKLLDYGATVKTAIVENGEETVVGIVSPDTDLQQVIAGLTEAYSNTTLVSKRSIDRTPKTIEVSRDPLDDVLTDRQYEMLELAYHSGFFESPRHSSGEEIAESVGISSPTFYLHVRKATLNLLEWLDEQGLFD